MISYNELTLIIVVITLTATVILVTSTLAYLAFGNRSRHQRRH